MRPAAAISPKHGHGGHSQHGHGGRPDDPASLPAEPALSDGAFEARLGFAANDLPAGFEVPAATP